MVSSAIHITHRQGRYNPHGHQRRRMRNRYQLHGLAKSHPDPTPRSTVEWVVESSPGGARSHHDCAPWTAWIFFRGCVILDHEPEDDQDIVWSKRVYIHTNHLLLETKYDRPNNSTMENQHLQLWTTYEQGDIQWSTMLKLWCVFVSIWQKIG